MATIFPGSIQRQARRPPAPGFLPRLSGAFQVGLGAGVPDGRGLRGIWGDTPISSPMNGESQGGIFEGGVEQGLIAGSGDVIVNEMQGLIGPTGQPGVPGPVGIGISGLPGPPGPKPTDAELKVLILSLFEQCV